MFEKMLFSANNLTSILESLYIIKTCIKEKQRLVIALEGPDNVGKTTLSDLLYHIISGSYENVHHVDGVHTMYLPNKFRSLVVKNLPESSMLTKTLAVILDAEITSNELLKATAGLDNRQIIIQDRSVYFSIPAYNLPFLPFEEKGIAVSALFNAPGILKPDITFIIDRESGIKDEDYIASIQDGGLKQRYLDMSTHKASRCNLASAIGYSRYEDVCAVETGYYILAQELGNTVTEIMSKIGEFLTENFN